ncbi:alpha-hydroxy-acid oxidizing protein [Sporosarcina sp. BP05]|uniref:alpha-hydroxy-acid oxidizing protein n=1 Tax=Sporosarcina sp. BP05 TaxID=2758726 RepID=UPI0016459EB7|nr:alpha-hydroxy-acid oxidizing protein [Sporosarcina sp. BP05]
MAQSYLEIEAGKKLSKEAFDYIARGSGEEVTMDANRKAFDKWTIRPRVLRNVSKRDFSVSLFGKTLKTPVFLAPIGVQRIAHPEGELASARAAASMGIPYIVSSVSSNSMEEIAEVMGNHLRWFQLYCSIEESVTESFVKRAEASGYSAIVITVDTPMLGIRKMDLLNNYSPLSGGYGCGNYITDPAFCNLLEKSPFEDKEAALQKQYDIIDQPNLNWLDLKKIRSYTTLPILLKGILHPDDAQLALDYGVDGIIVSNHGGRQLDQCIASLDALPEISEVIQGRIPILIDSGIRNGTDVVKALALGADCVLVGRPYIYGLATGGQDGVEKVLTHLLHEFDISMALAGICSIDEIEDSALVRNLE